ncbi:MAG TPA: sensor histidine kinase [Gaiellaceae bacterium]|nr:sensor histidine kinase [Gaiellaceae bacterium]
MSRIRHLARQWWFDLPIALLGLVAILEIVVGRNSGNARDETLWFVLPAIAVLVTPIFLRRRFPLGGPAAYWVLAAALALIDWRPIPYAVALFPVGLAVAFLLGNLRSTLQTAIGLSIVIAGSVIVVYQIPDSSTAELIFIPLEFAIAWLAGFAVRERSEQAEAAELRAAAAERERDAAARVAVAEERARIARELHDIVAHSVSVMVLQVGAVRHNLERDRAQDGEALKGVERAGRTALAEMRRLLGAMRSDGEEAELLPQPGLDGLGPLLDEVGRAGLPVELHVEGDACPLPRAIELSAYRIVQEGLTNALKHARATRADVTMRYEPSALQLEIRDDGLGNTTSDGLGHGLVGIRERVKIYGGQMSAGVANGGGFVLTTRLPLAP